MYSIGIPSDQRARLNRLPYVVAPSGHMTVFEYSIFFCFLSTKKTHPAGIRVCQKRSPAPLKSLQKDGACAEYDLGEGCASPIGVGEALLQWKYCSRKEVE